MFLKKLRNLFLLFLIFCHSIPVNCFYDSDIDRIKGLFKDPCFANAVQLFMIRINALPDPNKPSIWRKVGESTGEIIRVAVEGIGERVRKGEITPGQGLREIAMSLATTSKDIFMVFLPFIGAVSAIGVGAYGAKRGFDVAKEWYIKKMNTPQLLKEVIEPWQIKKSLDDLHFTGDTKKYVEEIINMAKTVSSSRGSAKFENVMLWGPPGTGKTAIIELIAKEAGMTVFKTSGGDFAKLKGKDLEQLDKVFEMARSNGKSVKNLYRGRPVLFFIDEMEDLFGSRSRDSLSEDGRKVLAKLLTEFSEPDSKILLIGATNRPEDLDEAMHRRMPQQIEVGLPDVEGRAEILKIYRRKLFFDDKNYSKENAQSIKTVLSDAATFSIAQKVGAIAPAELYNIMIMLKNRSWGYNKGIPTQKLINEIIDLKLKQLKARENGFKRSTVKG